MSRLKIMMIVSSLNKSKSQYFPKDSPEELINEIAEVSNRMRTVLYKGIIETRLGGGDFMLPKGWETETPTIENTLNKILPMYIQDIIYGIILDAKTAEHAARVNSMRSATDNATDVIDKLQVLYNRSRQEAITNELNDIVGGSNAIGGK